MEERAERLREAVRAAGGNQAVAARAGMHVGSLNNYLRGRDMKASAMVALADACAVGLEWLATGSGERRSTTAADSTRPDHAAFAVIPRYDVRASAVSGNDVEAEGLIGHVAFRGGWLNSTFHRGWENLAFIEASGDSMEPTFSGGDLLLVDTSASLPRNGGVYVLDVNGNLLVKRIQFRLDGTIAVKSDNAKYETEIVPASEAANLCIVGQVIWHGGVVGT